MKRFLIFILICIILIGFNELKSFADYSSPIVTEHDMRVRYYPSIATNLYRVCNNKGELVRFLDLKDVSYDLMDDLTDIHSNDRFTFSIKLNTELVQDEYMELIIIDDNELIVYNNDIKVPVDKFGEYNIIHILESGIIHIQ